MPTPQYGDYQFDIVINQCGAGEFREKQKEKS